MNKANTVIKEELKNTAYIAAGLALCVFGYNLFLIPNNIAAGGFTGASQLINSATGWPVGLVLLCLNVPLFLLSIKSMGLRFGLRSLITTVLLSALIDFVQLSPAAESPGLATLYGGLLTGAGFGLVLRGNATTGGTDMLASLLHKSFPTVPLGTMMSVFDGIVIVVSAFVYDTALALYALVAVIICNAVVDFILEGPESAVAFFIITDKPDEISSVVMDKMERGATAWPCTGMYTHSDKSVLLCAVSRREVLTLRRAVNEIDPCAFLISAAARGTYGEGFKMK